MAEENTASTLKDFSSLIAGFKTTMENLQQTDYYTKEELKYRIEPKYHIPQDKLEETWTLIKLSRAMSSSWIPYSRLSLTYVLTPEIAEELHICDQELAKIIKTGDDFARRANEYIAETITEEAISSSQLEGAATTELVARDMLRKNRQPKNKDEQMIVNNHQAMQYIRDKTDILLTPDFICEIQRIVTDKTLDDEQYSGAFRNTDNVRVINSQTGKPIHEPPKASEVPAMIEALCAFINADRIDNSDNRGFIHPLICGIALHFLIGYIHPFYDGNGRTARTLFYWYVLSRGYKVFEYIPISRVIKKAPGKYRDAYLATEKDELDLTYFILYNIRCMKKAREALGKHIQKEQIRAASLHEILSRLPGITARQTQMLIYMLEHREEVFTIEEIAARFGVVYQTARTDLKHLSDLKYLRMQKRDRAFTYVVDHTWALSVTQTPNY